MARFVNAISTGLTSLVFAGYVSSDVAAPAPHASLIRTCAPWDGPAVVLFLTEQLPRPTFPTPPYTEITVYQGVSQLPDRHFDLGPKNQNSGFAQDCPRGSGCVPIPAATLKFGTFSADSTISVNYRLELASGQVLRGVVRPRLSPKVVLCR